MYVCCLLVGVWFDDKRQCQVDRVSKKVTRREVQLRAMSEKLQRAARAADAREDVAATELRLAVTRSEKRMRLLKRAYKVCLAALS